MLVAKTLDDLLTMYDHDILSTRAPNTQYNQRLTFKTIRKDFGHIFLQDITPACLREWREKLRQRGLKPGTVRRYLDSLSGPLSAAVTEYEILPSNPMAKIRKPPHSPGRVRYLDDDERRRLLDACQDSRCKVLYPIVLVALATGGRKQEILQLTWADVELGQGTLRFLHTKTRVPRSVPLVGEGLEVLRAWQARQPEGMLYVFPSENATKGRHITTAWLYALKRSEVPQFRFHDLRHTFASYMAMSGASLIEIADLLGHKTLAMVRRYAHLSPAHTRGVVSRMAQQFLSCLLGLWAWAWLWWAEEGPQTVATLGGAVGWW